MALGENSGPHRKKVKKKGKAKKVSYNKKSRYYEKPYRGQGR